MCALGYVSKVDGGYTLGLRLKDLSKPLEQRDEAIRRHFAELIHSMAQLTNNTAYLAVPSGVGEYLYLDAVERDNPLTIRSPRGRREGLTTSAIGKVFLAFEDSLRRTLRISGEVSPELDEELSQVKLQGYALDLEQAEPELNCLAIPLYWHGKVVAAAGICGASSDLTAPRLIHFAGVFTRKSQ
ncbi:transcriptional regulator IclR family [Vibrio maritimus]|uniref:Transcriptional regulator IclR family n=1 Tax=Vibrio maritimus TaxID=990268 RepID=A0A090SWU6_9VIBR|nr:transcriptional regulator IclR family [Vibrio maritimus]